MSRPLYTKWFVAATVTPGTAHVGFWSDTHATHRIVYVIRTMCIAISTGTGKAWITARGPIPPYAQHVPSVLHVVNNLFTTPFAGPTNTGIQNVTIPLPRGSSLGFNGQSVHAVCTVAGWRLEYASTTTAPNRY